MPNPNISTQDWYYHAPAKKSDIPAKEAPPASQIPGIGGVADESVPPEFDDRQFRRKWIRDTDSKYIKLAKGGGRKGLLSYNTPPSRAEEPVAYPRVDWFDHEHPEDDEEHNEFDQETGHDHGCNEQKPEYHVLPDWYVHVHDVPSDDIVTGAYRSRRPIMAFDNLSKWQRDASEKDNHGAIRLPPLQKSLKKDKRYEELVAAQKNDPPPQRRQVRPPKIDSDPVNFMHLMSMGYQRDWLSEQQSITMDERAEKKKQLKESAEKRDAQIKNTASMRKSRDADATNRPAMFKLSRFENVHPRVETFRT